MIKVFRINYDGSEVSFTSEEAIRILMHVYKWDQEYIMNKKVSSIEYWLKRAMKNPDLKTVMMVDLVLNPVPLTKGKRGIFKRFLGK